MENVLSIQQLTKYYGSLCALHKVSFKIPRGSIFGLLGPNGSGKTTLLGIITNVLKANSGTYEWPTIRNRKTIGTLLETPNFFPYLSAQDNLKINAATKGCSFNDINRVLKIVQLYDRRLTLFKTFSLGMKQRMAIASALLGDPEIIILDEPTNGLDPVGIADIRNLIIQMGQSGKTVIIASHLLDEIEKVCTHVAVLKNGTIRATGPVRQVLSNEDIIEVSAEDLKLLENILAHCAGVKDIKKSTEQLQLTLESGFSPSQLNTFCFEQKVVLSKLHIQKKSLELKFLELTNDTNISK